MKCLARLSHRVSSLALAVALAGCAADSGPSQPADTPDTATTGGGREVKGDVVGASVTLYPLDHSGSPQTIGPFVTEADGSWNASSLGGLSGTLLINANGGTYTDEATQETVTVGNLWGILQPAKSSIGHITPFTEAVAINVQQRTAVGVDLATATEDAVAAITAGLGFDPTQVDPDLSPGASTASRNYAVLLAGVSQLLATAPALSPTFDDANKWDLVKALISDMTDGKLDGGVLVDPDGEGPVLPIPFPALDPSGVSALVNAANTWAATNAPGTVVPTIDLTEFADTGAPTYGVEGFLDVTGESTPSFGSIFTPDRADVIDTGGNPRIVLDSDNLSEVLTLTLDRVSGQASALLLESGSGDIWFANGLPIAGLTISETASEWTLVFDDTMAFSEYGSGFHFLDGTLTITSQ